MALIFTKTWDTGVAKNVRDFYDRTGCKFSGVSKLLAVAMAQGDRCIRAWCSQKNADDSGQAYVTGMASSQDFLVRALRMSSPLVLQFSPSTSKGYIIVKNLQPVHEEDNTLLKAIEVFRALNTTKRRTLPDDVPVDFVPD